MAGRPRGKQRASRSQADSPGEPDDDPVAGVPSPLPGDRQDSQGASASSGPLCPPSLARARRTAGDGKDAEPCRQPEDDDGPGQAQSPPDDPAPKCLTSPGPVWHLVWHLVRRQARPLGQPLVRRWHASDRTRATLHD